MVQEKKLIGWSLLGIGAMALALWWMNRRKPYEVPANNGPIMREKFAQDFYKELPKGSHISVYGLRHTKIRMDIPEINQIFVNQYIKEGGLSFLRNVGFTKLTLRNMEGDEWVVDLANHKVEKTKHRESRKGQGSAK